MKHSLSTIIYHLQDLEPTLCADNTGATTFYDVRTWVRDLPTYDPLLVYLCDYDFLCNQQSFPGAIICLGGGDDARDRIIRNCKQGIVLNADTDIDAILHRIQDVFLEYNDLDERLNTAIQLSEPLEAVLNICAEFFENPIMITDKSLNLIASSSNYPSAETDADWTEIHTTGQTSRQIMTSLKRERMTAKLHKAQEPILVDLGDTVTKYISSNFIERGERFASLAISEARTPLSPLLLDLARQITQKLTPVIKRYNKTVANSLSQAQRYIEEILHGQQVDPHMITYCLEFIGWNTHEDYTLLRIKLSANAFMEGIAEHSKNTYASIFEKSVVIDLHDTLVIVLGGNSMDEEMQPSFEALAKELTNDNSICGVSMPFRDFSILHQQYVLSGIAIELSDRDGRISPLVSYSQVMQKHLFGELSAIMPPQAICHSGVIRIHEYDKKNSGELLHSLQVYLQLERSLLAASKKLHIHRNTMVYRLDRISKIADLDLEDTDTRIHIMFSCAILEYLDSIAALE